MPRLVDDVILNPSEMCFQLAELNLSEEGLSTLEALWGDAKVEAHMVQQALGEIPVDRRPPNREVSLKLKVRGSIEVDLPTVAQRLQQVVGVMQRERGCWVRRDFYAEGHRFAGSVAYRVHGANLSGLGDWAKGNSPDVVLNLVCGPYCYAVEEEVSRTFSETTERELIFELPDVKGSAPGIFRCTITNDGAEDWRGAIFAIESRDMAQDSSKDTTAALAYEAEDLTLLSTSAIATLSGASGGASNNVVKHSNLSTSFQSILGSEINGVGNMTHVGTRRFWARPYAYGLGVELRLEWRALGGARWSSNQIVSIPTYNDFSLVDLGECRPDSATLGDQRWEWRLTARCPDFPGSDISIDKVWLLPTEQYLVAREPLELVTPTLFEAWSSFSSESGNITGDTLDDARNRWAVFAGSDTDDFTQLNGAAVRSRVSDTGTISAGLGLVGRAIGVSVVPDGNIAAEVTFSHSAAVSGVESGLILKAASPSTYGQSVRYICGDPSGTTSTIEVADGETVIDSFTVPLIGVPSHRLTVVLIGATASILLDGQLVGTSGVTDLLGSTGVYIYDEQAGATACTRTYDGFSAWIPETDAACFATGGIEFRSDGVSRQDATDDVWGQVIPDGFLPYAPPSGLEQRAARGIIIPTQGDLDQLSDRGTNRLSATVSSHAGYLYSREAAA